MSCMYTSIHPHTHTYITHVRTHTRLVCTDKAPLDNSEAMLGFKLKAAQLCTAISHHDALVDLVANGYERARFGAAGRRGSMVVYAMCVYADVHARRHVHVQVRKRAGVGGRRAGISVYVICMNAYIHSRRHVHIQVRKRAGAGRRRGV